MSGEVIAALIGLAGATLAGQMALWLRFEHRMTVLEERLMVREKLEDKRHKASGLSHYEDPLTP